MKIEKQKFKNNSRGFTLIELILYMGLLSTLLMVLVQLFGTIVNVNLESQASSAVSSDGRYILNRMIYDIGQATSISQPATAGVSGTTLQFSKSDGKTYTYSLSAGSNGQENLLLSDGTNSDQVNSYGTTVTTISFTPLKTTGTTGKETITISLTLKSIVQQEKGNQQQNFQTTIGIR